MTARGNGMYQIARSVLRASEMYDNAWNNEAHRHDRSLLDCCMLACNRNTTRQQLVYLVLTGTWNDGIEWAKQTVEDFEPSKRQKKAQHFGVV